MLQPSFSSKSIKQQYRYEVIAPGNIGCKSSLSEGNSYQRRLSTENHSDNNHDTLPSYLHKLDRYIWSNYLSHEECTEVKSTRVTSESTGPLNMYKLNVPVAPLQSEFLEHSIPHRSTGLASGECVGELVGLAVGLSVG